MSVLTDEQHRLLREKLMRTNDAAEHRRDDTPEATSNRFKEGKKAADELGRVFEDLAERVLSDGAACTPSL